MGRPVKALIKTKRLNLRLPRLEDFETWSRLRAENTAFLAKWEPKSHQDECDFTAFKKRVHWSLESHKKRTALGLLISKSVDQSLIGGITLSHIRRGPMSSANVGYWLVEDATRQGYMTEALGMLVAYAFTELDLSRIEAATLENNTASRRLLENSGFRYEGVAQAYMEINGRWRPHILYAKLRRDRIGAAGP